jgi:ATP-dependent Lon protease
MAIDPQNNTTQPLPPILQPVIEPEVVQTPQIVQPEVAQPVQLLQQDNSQQFASEFAELNRLLEQLNAAQMPKELLERASAMVLRLNKLIKYGSFSREFEPVEKYISWLLKLPWGKFSDDNLDINNVKKNLDATHFGLEEVKERILEYVAMLNLLKQKDLAANKDKSTETFSGEMSRLQGSSSHAPIICFVGVQGIGKTSIAKSIGVAMNRKFVRISLGGLANVSELRGISRGNYDAAPGQITKALIKTGVMNPLILMDEIDKVSDQGGIRSDVMAALLEILDPEQNSTFNDYYLDYPLDLSNVMFICTANNLGGISAALLDRLEIVRMSSYTDEEKQHIAKDYLLPKVMSATGIGKEQIIFDDDVWPLIIRPLGFDAGIRQLERNLTTLARKVAKLMITGQAQQIHITKDDFRQYFPMDFGVYS